MVRMMEKWEDKKRREDGKWENRKDFMFSHLCLVGRVEKWRDEKLFYLVENKVYINLSSCPY